MNSFGVNLQGRTCRFKRKGGSSPIKQLGPGDGYAFPQIFSKVTANCHRKREDTTPVTDWPTNKPS